MSGIVGSVLKMLAGPVQDVIGRIMQQIGILQDLQSQFGGFASALQGAWVGEDADAFVQEVQTRLIPEIMDLIAAIGGLPGGISNAMDLIRGADSTGRSLVSGLGDLFGSIF